MAGFGNAQHAGGGAQLAAPIHSVGKRFGQALGDPAIAFGPGEHAFARVIHRLARRVKPVAAGKVVDARPGRHARHARAVVVAAAVVQVPEQVLVIQALLRQPSTESHGIQRLMGRR
ncbi:hypothetical protein D3C71_1344050 [compost metagenome]